MDEGPRLFERGSVGILSLPVSPGGWYLFRRSLERLFRWERELCQDVHPPLKPLVQFKIGD